MKKVFYILTLDTHPLFFMSCFGDSRLFHIEEADSKTMAKQRAREERKYDKSQNYKHFKYVIIEGLVITKEKINEIITNSNVE